MASNYAAQDNDNSPVFLGYCHTGKGLTVLGSQGVLAAGSVLGKVKVAAGTATPDGSNTGNGTVTGLALSATGAVAKIGSYILTCVEAITNSGRFKLVDPDGIEIATNILIPAGAGNDVTFTGAGITFTITDGSTDFANDDFFTLTVTAGSGKYKLCVSTATDGSDIADAVLTEASDTGTSDITRDLGIRGDVNQDKLAFGGSDTIATLASNGKSHFDNLRNVGIVPIDTNEYAGYDN